MTRSWQSRAVALTLPLHVARRMRGCSIYTARSMTACGPSGELGLGARASLAEPVALGYLYRDDRESTPDRQPALCKRGGQILVSAEERHGV